MLCIHFNKETSECAAYNLDEKFQGCNTEGTCTCAGMEYPDDVCDHYNPGVEEDFDDGDVPGTGDEEDFDDGDVPGTGDEEDFDDGDVEGTGEDND